MIEVELDGYKYHYNKTEDGGYWTGVAGYSGSMGRYSNCRVPTCLNSPLRKVAIESGYSNEDFKPTKVDKPKKAYKKKQDKNSISIF